MNQCCSSLPQSRTQQCDCRHLLRFLYRLHQKDLIKTLELVPPSYIDGYRIWGLLSEDHQSVIGNYTLSLYSLEELNAAARVLEACNCCDRHQQRKNKID